MWCLDERALINGEVIEGINYLKVIFRVNFSDNLTMKFRMMKNLCTSLCMGLSCSWVYGQGLAASVAKPGLLLPSGVNPQKVNEILATLRPPSSVQTLEQGNNLKLGLSDIVESGLTRISMSSTLPRTDAMWLLSLAAQPEGGGALFGSVTLEPAAHPEVSMVVKLYKTQHLLLVVRAAGKYYGVHRHIKVGDSAVSGLTP